MAKNIPLLCPCETSPTHAHSNQSCQRTTWKAVANNFPEPRNCLAAFLALNTAEVLAGIKPANLLRINNRHYPCGRNMYQLWQQYGDDLLANCPLVAAVMHHNDDGVLLLLYSPALLQRRLNSRSARTFLHSLSYREPRNIDKTLEDLTRHFVDDKFPHEIGLFLGYPLKDVTAFMGRTKLTATAQRLWKIYGRSRRSIALADLYLRHHQHVAHALRNNQLSSFQLLQGGVA